MNSGQKQTVEQSIILVEYLVQNLLLIVDQELQSFSDRAYNRIFLPLGI